MSTAVTTTPPSDRSPDQLLFTGYDPGQFYDELIAPNGEPRPFAAAILQKNSLPCLSEFLKSGANWQTCAYLVQGITFTVYSDGRGTERLFPIRPVPAHHPRAQSGT